MISRPDPSEHLPYFSLYINHVPDTDPLPFLAAQSDAFLEELKAFVPEQTLQGYAEGKWSLREVVQHISDSERIFAYRMLRIARGDQQPLPGFEQDDYVKAGNANQIGWPALIAEFASVRQATVALAENLPASAFHNIGAANGHPISARAILYIIAGHVEHHRALIRKHYA
jgi:uncharacterized damage-inducible protein DinB